MGDKKDKKDKKKDKASKKSKDAAGMFESLGRQLDEVPQVRAAREVAERAREKLREVAERYQNAGENATENQDAENSDAQEGVTLGEAVEDVLGYVRRHPAQGVIAASLLGFFFGRIFRR
ncbi:MAG: hypothetical protein IIA67_11475 [Planctomycetes bacterium]|nr:hypothetical protein [Planctomycetota bacterium]